MQVWSDYICPFCHISRDRIEYLEREYNAQVQWLPFDLHPEYPEDGILRAALVATYGQEAIDGVAALAEESGMPHNPNPDVVPNSRKALELAEWARGFGPDAHRRLHDAIAELPAAAQQLPARCAQRSRNRGGCHRRRRRNRCLQRHIRRRA